MQSEEDSDTSENKLEEQKEIEEEEEVLQEDVDEEAVDEDIVDIVDKKEQKEEEKELTKPDMSQHQDLEADKMLEPLLQKKDELFKEMNKLLGQNQSTNLD